MILKAENIHTESYLENVALKLLPPPGPEPLAHRQS